MKESISDAAGRLAEAVETLKWAFIDTILQARCPICQRNFKPSVARDWHYLITTWGEHTRVCDDCYREVNSWRG
jgi:hypothetical protein